MEQEKISRIVDAAALKQAETYKEEGNGYYKGRIGVT